MRSKSYTKKNLFEIESTVATQNLNTGNLSSETTKALSQGGVTSVKVPVNQVKTPGNNNTQLNMTVSKEDLNKPEVKEYIRATNNDDSTDGTLTVTESVSFSKKELIDFLRSC